MVRWRWMVMALMVPVSVEAQTLTVHWQAPAGCPDEAALLRAVRAAGAPTQPRQSMVVDAVVSHPARWRVTITSHHGQREGTRTLEARSCERLTQGTAMVIALALEEAEAEAAATPIVTPTARPVPPPPVVFVDDDELPPILRPRPRIAPPPPRPTLHTALSLHTFVDVGMLPKPAPGVGLGFGVGGSTFGLHLQGSHLFERASDRAPSGAFMAMDGWRLALLGCAQGGRRWTMGLCAGLETTRLSARVEGFQRNEDDVSWMMAAAVRVRGGATIGTRVRVQGEVEAAVPWERIRYDVVGVGALHEVPSLTLRMGLTATVILP